MKTIVTGVALSFLALVAMCGVARADGTWRRYEEFHAHR